jgi:flagellar basal body L-ring protein FlgH
MKKSILLASLLAAVALTACGKKEEAAPVATPAPEASAPASAPVEAASAPAADASAPAASAAASN